MIKRGSDLAQKIKDSPAYQKAEDIARQVGETKSYQWTANQVKKGMEFINSKEGQNAMKALVGGTLAYTALYWTGVVDQSFKSVNLEDAHWILKYFTTLQTTRLVLWPTLNSKYFNHKNLKEISNNYLENMKEIYNEFNENLDSQSLEQAVKPTYFPVEAN